MRRPITIAIAVTMLSLFALMFRPMGMHDSTANAAAASPAPEPEYVLSSHHYLPIQDLELVW